ncbi:MAG: hypothetical protein HYZ10_11370 [Ignavibacteriales bacterium]|nr:hypothetical protein [Ignavibacteriales bacterium]
MKLNLNCPISKKQIEKYESFIERITGLIEKTKLPLLSCVLLQSSSELDENKDFFSKNSLKIFTGELLSKYLNEGWAMIGCYQQAAFLSSFHHTRASLELLAIYHWTVYKDNKIEKRVKKYFEFKELNLYNYYRKITNANVKDEHSLFSSVDENQVKVWEKKIDEWVKLFDVKDKDLSNVINWHHGCKIENMLSEFPNEKLKMFYTEISHATHFSPYSHSFGTVDSVLGLPINLDGDLTQINTPITIYLNSLEFLLNIIHHKIGFDSKVKFPKNKIY